MTSLYELTDEYASILADVDAAEGVLEGDLEARLDAIAGAFADKAENVAAVIRMLTLDAEIIKKEADRLAERAKVRTANADRLKAYLLSSMKRTSTPKIKGARFTMFVRANAPALHVLDEQQAIDCGFYKTKTEVDKAAIRSALDAGLDVPCAELRRSESVVIK